MIGIEGQKMVKVTPPAGAGRVGVIARGAIMDPFWNGTFFF